MDRHSSHISDTALNRRRNPSVHVQQQSPPRRADPPTDPALTVTADAAVLEALVDAAGALVEECVVQADPEGLTARAQDPATVALVDAAAPADAFASYDVAADAPLALGVDLGRLGELVALADADEPVRLALDHPARTLHVRVGELAYELALVDPDAIRDPPDELDVADQMSAAATLSGRAFAGGVRAADMVADHCAVGVDPGAAELYVRAEGDTDAVDVAHPAGDLPDFEAGDAHSLFSVSYLDAVAGVVPPDADVGVRVGTDAPLELAFEREGCSMGYLVAPRRRVR